MDNGNRTRKIPHGYGVMFYDSNNDIIKFYGQFENGNFIKGTMVDRDGKQYIGRWDVNHKPFDKFEIKDVTGKSLYFGDIDCEYRPKISIASEGPEHNNLTQQNNSLKPTDLILEFDELFTHFKK